MKLRHPAMQARRARARAWVPGCRSRASGFKEFAPAFHVPISSKWLKRERVSQKPAFLLVEGWDESSGDVGKNMNRPEQGFSEPAPADLSGLGLSVEGDDEPSGSC